MFRNDIEPRDPTLHLVWLTKILSSALAGWFSTPSEEEISDNKKEE